MSLRVLSLEEVKQCITMTQAIECMEAVFIQLANQKVTMPLRTGISIEEEEALTLTMPAYLAQDKTLGLKLVSIFPRNLAKNLPSITGFIMLLDATTGEPKVLMDAAYLTALRTGAVSGLATKYFAKEDATAVAIIGTGKQALTQLEAVSAVRPIKQVFLWSRNMKNAEIFAQKFEQQYHIVLCKSPAEAVKNADIICTATSSLEALIHFKDLKPQVHINAIGSHSRQMLEIDPVVLAHSIIFADQLEAVLSESGEIIQAIEQRLITKEKIIEIGAWLLHKKGNYKNQLTLFKSVGLAIQDLAVAEIVYKNALKNNLGISFSLTS